MHDDDDELQESGCIEHSGLRDSGAPWGSNTVYVFEVTCAVPESRATFVIISTRQKDSKVVDANTDSGMRQRGRGVSWLANQIGLDARQEVPILASCFPHKLINC